MSQLVKEGGVKEGDGGTSEKCPYIIIVSRTSSPEGENMIILHIPLMCFGILVLISVLGLCVDITVISTSLISPGNVGLNEPNC